METMARARSSRMCSRDGMPKVKLNAGGCARKSASSCASKGSIAGGGGGGVSVMLSSRRKLSSSGSTRSSSGASLSVGGDLTNRLTANGARVARFSSAVSCSSCAAVK